MEFVGFPKIARLNRDCIITEKIDGTNAQVFIRPIEGSDYELAVPAVAHNTDLGLVMFAGSRTRYITPDNDNFGFAAWVKANADELFKLGHGQHFGEWWGGKIQRGYGIAAKQFSLFNVSRWADPALRPVCCGVVPTLYTGPFSTEIVGTQIERLRTLGSVAAPGYMNPEGLVVFHTASQELFKVTLEGDGQPKGKRAA